MKQSFVGGQAVLEGVLLVFEGSYVVSVQSPDGIVTKKDTSSLLKSKLLNIPLIRGPVAFLIMAILGLKSMMYASQVSSEDGEELSSSALIVVLVGTLALIVLLFKVAPLVIARYVVPVSQPLLFNLVDGLLRIAAVIGYIALISRLPDIHRMYQYHGAEHKVINAFSSGKATLARARKQSRYLARCGTTFVVFVLLVAILVYSLTPINMALLPLLLLRLAFLIPIASLSYELIRFSSQRADNPVIKVLLAPGYWVQKLTVREPDDQQLKVALAALRAVTKS